jgi:hypothetical protein
MSRMKAPKAHAAFGHHGEDRQLDGDQAAILVQRFNFQQAVDGPGLAGFEVGRETRFMGAAMVRRHNHFAHALAYRFGGTPAEHPLRTVVPAGDETVGIHFEHGVARRIEQVLQVLLAALELFYFFQQAGLGVLCGNPCERQIRFTGCRGQCGHDVRVSDSPGCRHACGMDWAFSAMRVLKVNEKCCLRKVQRVVLHAGASCSKCRDSPTAQRLDSPEVFRKGFRRCRCLLTTSMLLKKQER